MSYKLELVKTLAGDGIRLDGGLAEADTASSEVMDLDAVLLIHGVGSSFYGATLLQNMTESFLEASVSVLHANTRGHDLVFSAYTPIGQRRYGSAYEIVDDCRKDLSGWLRFLKKRGYERIGLVGHSLGALKSMYVEAHEHNELVKCIVAMSPPRFSSVAFRNGVDSSVYNMAVREAQKLVEAGEGDRIMEISFPYPLLVSARTYLDKYGSEDRYNLLDFIGKLTVPTLLIYGSKELEGTNVAFNGVPEAIAERDDLDNFTVDVIQDGDHLYTGVLGQLNQVVFDWLGKQ